MARTAYPLHHSWTYLQLEEELDLFRGSPPASLPLRDRQLRLILEKIHRDPFYPDLNVQYLKRQCKIHDNNISTRFRFRIGTTIHTYIEKLRIDAARHLLIKAPSGIFDIALSVGYSYPQTFYNAFKRHNDCTPAEYRDRAAHPVHPIR